MLPRPGCEIHGMPGSRRERNRMAAALLCWPRDCPLAARGGLLRDGPAGRYGARRGLSGVLTLVAGDGFGDVRGSEVFGRVAVQDLVRRRRGSGGGCCRNGHKSSMRAQGPRTAGSLRRRGRWEPGHGGVRAGSEGEVAGPGRCVARSAAVQIVVQLIEDGSVSRSRNRTMRR